MIFIRRPPVATVALNMRPKRGPYGGGNQWLNQLASYLKRCGYAVQFHLDKHVDCVAGTHAGLGGGLAFRYEDILRAKAKNPHLVCIQRINDNDARKATDGMDRQLAEANRAADHTVFVSEWLRDYHASRWFNTAKPHSVILNGADPSIFHPIGAAAWTPSSPLRLVTHHWSDNMSKGFDLYQDIDEAIAAGALREAELWVIGRWPSKITWQKARTFRPCVGHKLAGLLRQCHGYVTGSRYTNPEPCTRSKDFNAGFHCSITPRREGPLSWAADSGSKYRTISLPHSQVFATPMVTCGKRSWPILRPETPCVSATAD